MVCLSWATETAHGLLSREDAIPFARRLFDDPSQIIVAANLGYELGVLCAEDPWFLRKSFELLEAGRFRDVIIAQKMRDIRDGMLEFGEDEDGEVIKQRHSLADLIFRYTKKSRFHQKTGPGIWRLRYNEFDGVPISDWPAEAAAYAIEDSEDTLTVNTFQGDPIPDELRQIRYQWSLDLMGIWGVRTDPAAVAVVKDVLQAEVDAGSQEMVARGLMVVAKGKAKRVMSIIYDRVTRAYKAQGLEVPLTDGGRPGTSRDILEESGDLDLLQLAQTMKAARTLNKDVPQMERATTVPLCVGWNGLVATGRTSARPNVQNLPRGGDVRSCYVPRPGWVYCAVDLDTAELRALAQVCLNLFGRSELANVLKADQDPHSSLGAEILRIPYEEMIARLAAGDKEAEQTRQFAKIPNFGLPGGMGEDSLIAWAKNQGVHLTREHAGNLIAAWKNKFTEMADYFRLFSDICGAHGSHQVTQMYSDRVRGGLRYCAGCNTMFQGLVADAAKSALYNVVKECYTDRASVMFGARPVLFIHDEVIAEFPLDAWGPERTHKAAERMTEVILSAAQPYMPDIPVKGKPVMMRRWLKGAKPVHVDGLLVPGRPEIKDGKTLWLSDAGPPLSA